MAAPAAAQTILAASTKIVVAGRNYVARAKDLGNPVLKEPMLFLKPTSSFLHAGPTAGAIEVPEPLESLHHEVGLAVVISWRARDVPEASAMDFVGARTYTPCYEETGNLEHDRRKDRDSGNEQTPPSVVGLFRNLLSCTDPYNLELWLKVDDELRQKGLTSDIKDSFLISYISSIMTLMEGDVILTGTPPEGVGPLRVGQKIKAVITGLLDVEFDVCSESQTAIHYLMQ